LKAISIFLFLIFSLNSFANSVVAIGEAEVEKNNLAIIGPVSEDGVALGKYKWATDILSNNFKFYKKYFNVNRYEKETDELTESYKVTLIVDDQGLPKVKLVSKSSKDFLIQAPDALNESNRFLVHQLADEVYQRIMKKKSIFKSKIFYVCETKREGNDILKELFVMDFDGKNKKQLTRHNGLVMSPGISNDNSKVIYSLISNVVNAKRNIDLHMLDLKTGGTKKISSKKGINSGAVFMPGDRSILLTLSHRGNADIYSFNLTSKKYTQLTKKFSAEVDPSISNDGRMMTFLSDRPGKPMIYTMNPSGIEKNVKRIGWVGQYNATPRFSPDGKEIAFSSWLDNRFDIFKLNADGSGLSRLTKDFGSNEDPTFSNDGEFIAFTSQRVISRTQATQGIYIMDRYGEIIETERNGKKTGNFTSNYKICTSPRWSR
jgi:TolB protein